MSTRQILVEEHLPYVLPIVFSTTNETTSTGRSGWK